ncbi:MAG: hypothetical protein WC533_03535 [Candidatus Pacearchaeota archaeon]
MTKLSELKAGQGSVNIEVTVKSLEEPRTINKYGKALRLANAVVTDGDSEIKLTLWNQDVDKVNVGSAIKITNGYISEFQGERQLTSGKFGKIEILGGSDVKPKKPKRNENEDDDSEDNLEDESEDEDDESEDVEDY